MEEKLEKFLKVYKVELEDIKEDLESLKEMTLLRYKKHEITKYVSLENMGILEVEKLAINRFIKIVENFDVSDIDAINQLIEKLEREFNKEVDIDDVPLGMYTLACRKLKKVNSYLHSE